MADAQTKSITVEDMGTDFMRIDKYLSERESGLSRSYIQKLLKDGMVLVNGVPVKSNYRIQVGEEIVCHFPALTEPEITPEHIPLDILFEDDQILVVNKPKGMVVHPAPGHNSGTLVNAVLYHCKDRLSGINGVMRPGIVHRIDMDTTGSLVICKTDIAHRSLAEQLKNHSIKRIYHAIVFGNLKEQEGTIDAPIGRHPINRKKMSIHARQARRAVTHYQVLDELRGYTYVSCQLETGRTHQIRVHMASIHHPILGDTIYGPVKQPFHLQGQTLHAKTLGFIHPTTNQYMEFDAPLPDYFKELLVKLEKQC